MPAIAIVKETKRGLNGPKGVISAWLGYDVDVARW